MFQYATRLPPGKGVSLCDDNLTVRKQACCGSRATLDFIETLAYHLIKYPDPTIVNIYDFQILNYVGGNYIYCYHMERLGILSPEEKELIDFVGSTYDYHAANACRLDIEYPYRDEYPDLFEFLKDLTMKDRYWDIHSGNIMMTPDLTYCTLDIEGFVKIPLEQKCNDWISR